MWETDFWPQSPKVTLAQHEPQTEASGQWPPLWLTCTGALPNILHPPWVPDLSKLPGVSREVLKQVHEVVEKVLWG